jgi:hypothetical protein
MVDWRASKRKKLTPKDLVVVARMVAMSVGICSGGTRLTPSVPNPPALLTAATMATEV